MMMMSEFMAYFSEIADSFTKLGFATAGEQLAANLTADETPVTGYYIQIAIIREQFLVETGNSLPEALMSKIAVGVNRCDRIVSD